MSNKVYDKLKFLALIFLPAIATLYFALAQIWGLPAAEQVVGTIVAVETFLGMVLRISAGKYVAEESPVVGTFLAEDAEDGKKTVTIDVDIPVEEMLAKSEVRFKINDKSTTTE